MPGSVTADDAEEWSCGTCTFLNKPLFLSCEMCGQARPSQRPSPPRRQPSPAPLVDRYTDYVEVEVDEPIVGGGGGFHRLDDVSGNSNDRAPRSVQRHHSTVNITGTLIMTDDPADYETQDGKKPGEVSDNEEVEPELELELELDVRRRQEDDPSIEDDPSLDDSIDRRAPVPLHHEPTPHYRDGRDRFHERPQHRRARTVADPHYTNEPPRRHPSREYCRESFSSRASSSYHHHAAHHPQQLHQAPPSTSSRKSHGSQHTLPTQYMSSSSRIGIEEANDDVSDISGMSGSYSNSARHYHHPHPHSTRGGDYMGNGSGRHHLMSDRSMPSSTRNMGFQPLHHHQHQHQHQHPHQSMPRQHHHQEAVQAHFPQRNGLPVITAPPRRLMGDHSHGSYCSSPAAPPRGTRRPTLNQPHHPQQPSFRRAPSVQAVSTRNLGAIPPLQPQQPYHPDARSVCSNNTSLSRAPSVAALPSSNTACANGVFLPPITPPPVPTMDMPTDVNVMEVFVKDHQAAERRAAAGMDHSRRRSTEVVRKDRASMLDSLSRNNNFASNRSIGGSGMVLGTSTRRMDQPSSRALGSSSRQFEDASVNHPGEMLDSEALDSPNTRKERRKERRKMKGAVRTLMATMRISNK
ncbi:expressed unknown protein [Seminavis robusta]|uniref:RanBP2-type domain-containing protein n=1 Tax=Seminavis robusta TaxID=568900 RepID=A0A9N8H8A5_9STRA|nr:expressed unknown protein [Seminavis robusta]|eukprot:Sro233_g094110.1 n/a (634) ;mRNA; f:7877-9778